MLAVAQRVVTASAHPFLGQENRWPAADQAMYHALLEAADDTIVVCERYAPWAFQKRNEAMVDALVGPDDMLLAAWNGKTSGGTWNCLQYAKKVNASILHVDPTTRTMRPL